MGVTKKGTVPDSSIGVDVGQPLSKNTNEIITNISTQNNLQATEKSTTGQFSGCRATKGTCSKELEVISMDELYDTNYPPKIPLVEGLFYSGMYLFVGAPKVGKSFFMAQLNLVTTSARGPVLGRPCPKGCGSLSGTGR